MSLATVFDILIIAVTVISTIAFIRWAITERHDVDARTMRVAILKRAAAVVVVGVFFLLDLPAFDSITERLVGGPMILVVPVAIAGIVVFLLAADEITTFPSGSKTDDPSHRRETPYAAHRP